MRDTDRRPAPPRSYRRCARSAGRRLVLGGALLCLLGALGAGSARAQGFFLFRQPQRPVTQAIPVQPGAVIYQSVYDSVSPESSHVVVSIPKQRVYLLNKADEVAIDSPVSSGRPGHGTPPGSYRISAKEPAHYSNIYGNFVDKTGRVVRSGVSARIDSAPSGTHFEGAPMRWFMRLDETAVGLHVGILPGYPASHGCVRLPSDIAPLIYQKVKGGTPVRVEG